MSDPAIYVIDDDEAARDGLVFLLTSSNFLVHDYSSARAFVDGITAAPRGCVITDLSMPEMSGIDLIRQLKSLAIDWPVIVVTGQGDLTLVVEALRAGAVDFIEKPFDADVLLNAVAGAVKMLDGAIDGRGRTEIQQRLATLSAEEHRVFNGLTNGQSTAALAQNLRLAQRTVEIHRINVMTKMQASGLSDLVRMAILTAAQTPQKNNSML